MKVKFRVGCYIGGLGVFKPQEIAEIDEEMAKHLLDSNDVEEVKEEKKKKLKKEKSG